MNNKSIYIAAVLMAGAVATGCRDEHVLGTGEGRMMLEASIKSDIKVVSRALSAEEQNKMCNSALIWISDKSENSKGLLYTFNGIGEFPAAGLPLSVGHYMVEAWLGDSIPATFDQTMKRYKGEEEFDIERGQTSNVKITCPVRNTIVSVKYAESVAEVLENVKLTVSLNDGYTVDDAHSLVYEGLAPADKGYYMTNTRTEGFKWVLEGTEKANGNSFRKEGVYKDPAIEKIPYLAQHTEYVFNINYGAGEEDPIGGGYFDIVIEPEPVEGEDVEVVVAMPPEIKGVGFELGETQAGEPGKNKRYVVNIIASKALGGVHIEGSLLEGVGLAADYDLLNMTDPAHEANMKEKGFTFQTFKGIEGSDAITNVRMIMEKEMLNSLETGNYEMKITATEAENEEEARESSAVFAISINDAPLILKPTAEGDIDYTSARLSATVKDASKHQALYFEVSKAGSGNWTRVEGTVAGETLNGVAEGLEQNTVYDYRAVADDYSTGEMSFVTKAYPQLPNAGFEDWSKPGKPWLPYVDEGNRFWDTGNHGSTTMSADASVTIPDESIKHSGKYSARLTSDFVGIGVIGKLAAGNIFTGDYLQTDGTDGILGWGKDFSSPVRPKALRGYIRYVPVAVTHAKSNPADMKKGDMDQGIVYMALLTGEDDPRKDSFKGYPVVIRTKTTQLFDKNASNVVAYGEQVFTAATPGEGMIEFTINLEDVHGSLDVAKILVVASASRYGDYFTGGEGSTMWLDDLELVY